MSEEISLIEKFEICTNLGVIKIEWESVSTNCYLEGVDFVKMEYPEKVRHNE